MRRDSSIDAVGGVLIIYMILTHVPPRLGGEYFACYEYLSAVLFFFMAWFYFKSGMFSHPVTLMNTLRKYIDKLIRPYLMYSLLGIVLGITLLYCNNGDIITYIENQCLSYFYMSGAVDGNLPLWFLLSLFFVVIIYNLKEEKEISDKWMSIAAFVWFSILVLVKWFVKHNGGIFPVPYLFINVPLGLFFFIVGKHVKLRYFTAILCGLIYSVSLLLLPVQFDFRTGDAVKLYMIFAYIPYALSGIILFNYIFMHIPYVALVPFAFVGRNAMTIYVSHWLFIDLARLTRMFFHLTYSQTLFLTFLYIVVGTFILIHAGKVLKVIKV